ncbi:MAG TPA: GNAT family N-acetyltransferase [Gammaproteobacteria bacterium]|jgi:GNAT superfamily N-acetyltransferase|nr:GNAT family N-acetyltransferase [Gammaproteobacteria bacterium]
MEIVQATAAHAARHAGEFADLMHATGPVTYDYQFDGRDLFDQIVDASWRTPGTLFAYDGTMLALDGEELLGIEVGFHAPQFEQRKKALASLWPALIEAGKVSTEQLTRIAERTYQCSYLNAAIPSSVYYIHALAVKDAYRGKGIGAKLVRNAIDNGKEAGLRALHLDVLSDNPAVEFYRALGMRCLVESTAPVPLQHGVPMEMRMAIDFER